MINMLEKAIEIAVAAHKGQVDKSGRPYILHPLHLMMQMETEEEMVTAVLHDVVEDSEMTLADLAAEGFSESVMTAVALLTHNKSQASYEEYMAAIQSNPLARTVKLADLTHNMDIRRLANLDRKAQQRLQKYHRAWKRLHDA